jgi:histidinol-phosphatase (PHP family)
MTWDCHVHSRFSVDCDEPLEAMCASALANGLSGVCFTEHFDANPIDAGFGFYDDAAFSEAIERARERFDGRLSIAKGIEFSEPHRWPREYERTLAFGFDFVLASIHYLGDDWVGDPSFVRRLGVEGVFERHYEETLALCRTGGFDALAHIDFPKRYLGRSSEPEAVIAETMRALVSSGASLEINTSPLRKGLPEPCPSGRLLAAYAREGGRFVTLGSDAHRAADVGAGIAGLSIPEALVPCRYERRSRVPLER